jgi:Domain of unknown function (DUF4232)
MPDFDQRLAGLADAAGDAASPQPAAAVRARAGWMLRRRRVATLAAVAIAVGGIAVAAAQAFPGTRGPIVATSPAPSPKSSPASSPAPSPVSSPSVAASSSSPIVLCRPGDVAAQWGPPDSGSTHRGAPLILTNTLSRACRLSGYPTVVAAYPDGSTIQAQPTRSGYLGGVHGAPSVIDLAPGKTASAYVEALAIEAATGNGCGSFTMISVRLSGDPGSLKVPSWSDDACSELEVHPFVPGSTGRQ